jgi:branched-subunit amino acid transport protein
MQPSTTQVVVAILCLAAATFVTRAGMLLVGERLRLSHRVEAALRFAPVCALSALIVPEILGPTGVVDVSLTNPRVPAALLAAGFLAWRHSVHGGIAVGMAVYTLVRLWSGR